ncbi:hypothetical protein [Sphingobacterium arenae]|uniref:Secreted protein n=1 Tax=Sphingobacterium arenae TaxID=1280598 RepID=A0ABR7Y6S3_9SPHI|nr:hypothetical protein [Sphingobacterium arenae]MBD1426974.1 hypothetical protein [Sphingobacterium arenae]
MKITNNTPKIFFVFLVLPLLSGSYPIPQSSNTETNAMESCAITCAGKSTISRAALIMQVAAPRIENEQGTDTTRLIRSNRDKVPGKK